MSPMGTRRDVLRAGLIIGGGIALGGIGAGVAGRPAAAAGSTSPVSTSSIGHNHHGRFRAADLQVMTVTEDSLTVCWATWDALRLEEGRPVGVPTNGRLRVWPKSAGSDLRTVRPEAVREVHSLGEAAFHLLTVEGLEPDTDYCFEADSEGARAKPTHHLIEESRRVVRTLPRLPGELLETIVVANDVHIGETVDGVLVGEFPPPARVPEGARPYPEVALAAVIEGARRAGASRLFVNGDLTSEARPEEVRRARELLDTFPGRWRVTRGNHDRPHRADQDARYAECSTYTPPEGALSSAARDEGRDYRDCFGEHFGERQRPWVEELDSGGRVVGVDSTTLDSSGGAIASDQMDELGDILRSEPTRRTVVMLHHPVTNEAAFTNPGTPAFVLNRRDAMKFQRLVEQTPGVALVMAGHTHRSRHNRPDVATEAVFLETPAAKSWPTGATHLRFFDDGIMVNFRHNMGAEAHDWAMRTRWTQFGLSPALGSGTVDSRNMVIRC
ncbi:calcineurin-like phosphoesterase family protein [Propioniferax innocua]|uniref:Calcineurin-like phosphoesterase family protein n=2 Tax=Propioniferax innocua TaxID=1753 RepID=A0A542ZRK7_9ACTN|nr:calcineurin-like phosphoesterase family protein [Propioniferax innocua]